MFLVHFTDAIHFRTNRLVTKRCYHHPPIYCHNLELIGTKLNQLYSGLCLI